MRYLIFAVIVPMLYSSLAAAAPETAPQAPSYSYDRLKDYTSPSASTAFGRSRPMPLGWRSISA